MDRKTQAKQTDIISLLSSYGYKPSKLGTTKAWYNSPLADESKASFVVDVQRNTWRDFGRGKSGDVIEFVKEYRGCDFPDAISIILDGDVVTKKHTPPTHPIKDSTIKIVDVKRIQNKYLIEYAKSRAIGYEVLAKHCKEVDFVFSDWDHVSHTSIGFENSKGGWELRSASKKVGNSPKYWSMIRGTEDVDACDVFEGFFDFLSHLQYHDLVEPERDSFILNSLSFCGWVKPSLDMYGTVALYFDNDEAAERHTKEHFNGDKYAICNTFYAGYPDYNEFLKSTIK